MSKTQAKQYPPGKLIDWLREQVKNCSGDECMEWPYGYASHGYGVVGVTPGVSNTVPREAYKVAHGRYPTPMVLHGCNNKRCFNPFHLTEGDDAANTADKQRAGTSKGGSLPGEHHPSVILTEEQVREIRAAYVPRKVTFEALGKRYGVSMHTIFDIVKRRSWTHI